MLEAASPGGDSSRGRCPHCFTHTRRHKQQVKQTRRQRRGDDGDDATNILKPCHQPWKRLWFFYSCYSLHRTDLYTRMTRKSIPDWMIHLLEFLVSYTDTYLKAKRLFVEPAFKSPGTHTLLKISVTNFIKPLSEGRNIVINEGEREKKGTKHNQHKARTLAGFSPSLSN